MMTDITQLDPDGTYTYADYLKWHFDKSVELIKGKLYRMPPAPRRKHQDASVNLENFIFNYLESKTCKVYDAPFDVRLPLQNRKNRSRFTPSYNSIFG